MDNFEKIKNTCFITPVILAGGIGTRLWPISRKTFPKQFSLFFGEKSLFQKTVLRLQSNKNINFESPIILTNYEYRFIVRDQLEEIGQKDFNIIIEPEEKNTAPAILVSSILIDQKIKNSLVLVLPSDQIINDDDYFYETILKGIKETDSGNIITFGIKPTRAETGYGYLEFTDVNSHNPTRINKFIEKPSLKEAKKMLGSKNFFWNAGIFLFKTNEIINAFKNYTNFFPNVKKSIDKGIVDLCFFFLDQKSWSKLEKISIDYALMEKIDNIVGIPYLSHWSDLGSWDSVLLEKKLIDENTLSKNVLAIDTKDSFLYSEKINTHIVGLGIKNIIAIATPDAILVADKKYSQDVKKVVSTLKSQNIIQSETSLKCHRPWGWYEILTNGIGYQVKRIVLKPKAIISLQSHKFRSEHWIIVEGSGKVTLDKKIKNLNDGESIFIPANSLHRLENIGKKLLIVIEVQIGSYLGEDDIIRYEDIYSRV